MSLKNKNGLIDWCCWQRHLRNVSAKYTNQSLIWIYDRKCILQHTSMVHKWYISTDLLRKNIDRHVTPRQYTIMDDRFDKKALLLMLTELTIVGVQSYFISTVCVQNYSL